jgi:photosystem II stability/assembly factor-like uncharacterized protein
VKQYTFMLFIISFVLVKCGCGIDVGIAIEDYLFFSEGEVFLTAKGEYHDAGQYIYTAMYGNLYHVSLHLVSPSDIEIKSVLTRIRPPDYPHLTGVLPKIRPAGFPPVTIVIGNNGTIVRSTRDNPDWTLIENPRRTTLNAIDYCWTGEGELQFFIVGNDATLLRSNDTGLTWEIIPFPGFGDLRDIEFNTRNCNNITIAGETGLYLSANGGIDWFGDGFDNPLTKNPYLLDVHFTDEYTATSVGFLTERLDDVHPSERIYHGIILRTTDGGEKWIGWKYPDYMLQSVYFTSDNTGTVVGAGGTILRTTNGGKDWVHQNSGTFAWLNSVHFVNENTGTAVGSAGTIIRTIDGGNNWEMQTSGVDNWLMGVHFVNENTGFAVGSDGIILRTIDGGTTWVNQTVDEFYLFNSVHFTDENTGTIVGSSGKILRTTDGGNQWMIQNSGTDLSLLDIHFVNNGTGFTVGAFNRILKTTDGGDQWIIEEMDSDNLSQYIWFTGIHFLNENTGIIVGDFGTILITTDGGENWSPVPASPTGRYTPDGQYITKKFLDSSPADQSGTGFTKIYFYNDTLGFTAGYGGVIRKTTDGGSSWTSHIADGMDEINDIYFVTPDTGIVVGAHGQARFTADGGETWFEESAVTEYLDSRNVNGILAFSPNYGFIYGENLNMFIARDSTYLDSLLVTSVDDLATAVSDFRLYQNYPNPFNPITTIVYSVPQTGHVSLKIYDIAGREIKNLVNDTIPTGIHSVFFDASGLASGVYFYRLEMHPVTGSIPGTDAILTKTKKLIFVK